MIGVTKKSPAKLLWIGFFTAGVFLLMQVLLPLVSFESWKIIHQINNNPLVSPQISQKDVLGISIQNNGNFPAFISTARRSAISGYSRFTISVPKIKIDKESVEVDSNDLSSGLVHLPGSSLPGQKGNVFISGHSALSQVLNIKNIVFSRLPQLKKGDQIIVEALGSKYIYEVIDLKIVNPSDLSVLFPIDEQGRYISLMTCVPPGLNYKRLVVLGKLI